ncbi:MAG: sugar phosphate nucleotidyltransferase, partial [Patescibacteria group bacterium]
LKISGVKLQIVEQKDLDDGMAGGVLAARAKFKKGEGCIVVSANDVVSEALYREVAKMNVKGDGIIVGKKVREYFPGGYLKIERGIITKIVEKPKQGTEPSDVVNLVVHRFEDAGALFNYVEKAKSKSDDSYEVGLQNWFSSGGKFGVLRYDGFWQPVKFPWHVLALMKHFVCKKKVEKNLSIAKSAKITGDVVLEDGVRILDNAVVIGPAYIGRNTVIGNNAFVRESHVGADCVIGFGSEVARSYLGNNVWLHNNYIGDSVIGNDVAFGAGAITGNYRLDGKTISMNVKGVKIDTGLIKLGLVTGDRVRVGINTSFMPGITVGSDSFVGAGIMVGQDIPAGFFVRGDWKLKISKNRQA